MAGKNNATCAICGKQYHMCISCKDFMRMSPWKIHTDTAEHYKIFQIIRGYSNGVYDKNEAKLRLKNVDLSDLDSLRDNIKSIIKDIMKEETDDSVEVDHGDTVITKPRTRRKKTAEADVADAAE